MKKLIYAIIPSIVLGLSSPAISTELDDYEILIKKDGLQEKVIEQISFRLSDSTLDDKKIIEGLLDDYFGQENKKIEEQRKYSRLYDDSINGKINYEKSIVDKGLSKESVIMSYGNLSGFDGFEINLTLKLKGNNEEKLFKDIAEKLDFDILNID